MVGEITVIQLGIIITGLISPTIMATAVGIMRDGITTTVIIMDFTGIIILIGMLTTVIIQIIGGIATLIQVLMRVAM